MNPRHFIASCVGALFAMLALVTTCSALTVVTVPQNPNDANVPHPAYNGHPTMFKAIVRGGPSTIYYRWDVDGNGTWDDLLGRSHSTSPGGWTWYETTNLDRVEGSAFLPTVDPAVTTRKVFIATVEVATSINAAGNPVGGSWFGTYPVMVFADVPVPKYPALTLAATPEQVNVMRTVAVQDALWFLHKSMTGRAGSGAAITGYMAGGDPLAATALFVMAMHEAGRAGAYPPGTYQDFGQSVPSGFLAANDLRYNTDPYAEDVARAQNWLLSQLTSVSIPTEDEADDGTTPLPGTNDGLGYRAASSDNEWGRLSLPLAALAGCGLEGTVAQLNAIVQGKPMEVVVQQMVDYAVAAQVDENSTAKAIGAWTYDPCFGSVVDPRWLVSYITGGQVVALAQAESRMGPSGVHVNDRVKRRLANSLYYNQGTDGAACYNSVGFYPSLHEPTGNMMLGCRWLGWDQWSSDDSTDAGYPHIALTRGQARQVYDRYHDYLVRRWADPGGGGWFDSTAHLWQNGRYYRLPADTTCGVWSSNHWTMTAVGVRNAATLVGAGPTMTQFGTHDWAREFAISLAEWQWDVTQRRWCGYDFGPLADGGATDNHPGATSMVGGSVGILGTTSLGVLMCAWRGQGSPPVAVLGVPADSAVVGTRVQFQGDAWDLDGSVASRVLDFGDGSPPVELAQDSSYEARHAYAAPGSYSALLVVTDDSGLADSSTVVVYAAPQGAALTAVGHAAGSGSGSTRAVDLFWAALPPGHTLELWRAGYGNYPAYGTGGSVPPVPASYPPEAYRWGTAPVATGLTGTSATDLPPDRGYYYYLAFRTDPLGNRSWASNRVCALDYLLGDVSDGYTAGLGDNSVGDEDISLLGAHYGATGAGLVPVRYLDVGPTSNGWVDGLPLPDGVAEFEDLVIFALNFGASAQVVQPPVAALAAGTDALTLVRPAAVAPGETVTATLSLSGSGRLRAISTKLAWDPAVVEPVGHAAGEWLAERRGVAFSATPGTVDAATLSGEGLAGDGMLATVRFRVLAAGDPGIRIEMLDGRDAGNRKVAVAQSEELLAAAPPRVTALQPAMPNPFRNEVTLAFSLAERGPVSLRIYSVDGRLVRTLVSGSQEPGYYRPTWDGRDDRGNAVSAGVFYARLVAGRVAVTRVVSYLR